jgi:SulP family sulfate permease
VPALDWGRRYRAAMLRSDIVAGATAGAVVIPQAMAYATVAGLPVQAGLYCALVPMAVYAVLGTSRALSVSTTSTISLLTGQAIVEAGASDPKQALVLAGTLALLTGVILLVAGILGLGFLSDFIGPQVLAGFKIGVGLVILVDQLSKVLGITVTGDNFFAKVGSAVRHLGDTDPTTAVLAGLSVVTLLALARLVPSVPGPLVVLAAGIVAVTVLSLGDHGVALIDPIPRGLPAPDWPGLQGAGSLLPAAAGIALMSFVESNAAARAFRRPDDPPIDANQELVALGAANGLGGVFGAFPAGGGLSQTAVNDKAGATSQAASLVTVLGVILTLTLIAPVFDHLAQATLGAIVLVSAFGLVDREPLKELRRVHRTQWLMALVPLVGVLAFGTVEGVLLGVLASMAALLYALSHSPMSSVDRSGRPSSYDVRAERPDGLLVLRVEAVLYFANVRVVLDRLVAAATDVERPPRILVLDLVGQGEAGAAVADALQELRRRLEREGVTLWLSGVRPHVETMLRRTTSWGTDPIPVFETVVEAADAFDRLP